MSLFLGPTHRDQIPATPLLPHIEKYILEFSLEELARTSKVNTKRIWEIRSGSKDTIAFDLADRLLLAMDEGFLLWYNDPELSAIYHSVDLSVSNPSTIPRDRCRGVKCFEKVKGTRFCSQECKDSLVEEPTEPYPSPTCSKGHERTPENTYLYVAKSGKSKGQKSWRCRVCHNENNRRAGKKWRAKKREEEKWLAAKVRSQHLVLS